LRPSKAEEELRNREPPLLLVLPGSRTSEIERLAPLFGQVVHLIARKQTIEVVLPTIPSQVERVKTHVTNWPVKPRIVTGESEKYSAFRRARAALAASGTVTLELALAHVPMAAAYRVPRWEELIARRFAVATSAILPNIILGERVVPELLQQDATVEKMAAVLAPLLTDSPERARQIAGFARLDEIFDTGTKTASERAAKIVMEVYENKRKLISAAQHLR